MLTYKQSVEEKKITEPDNDWQQLNKAPVWQRQIDDTHKQTPEPVLFCASTNEAEREKVFSSLLPIQIGV